MKRSPVRIIRAAYSILPPFVTEDTDGNNGVKIGGFMRPMVEAIAQWMNFSLIYVKEPGNQYGDFRNGTWTGMRGMLFRNETDIILNPVLPQPEAMDVTFYTNPVIMEAFTALSGKQREEAGFFVYFNVLSPKVWGAIGLSLLLIASVAMLLYMNIPGNNRMTWLQTWWEYAWFYFSAMLNQGPNEKLLLRKSKYYLSTFLSVFAIIWGVGIAFLVMSVFQTKLVSKLTVVKSEPLVKTLEDFANKVHIKATTAEEIELQMVLKGSGNPVYEKSWKRVEPNLMKMKQLFSEKVMDDVEKGKITLLHGYLIIQSELRNRFQAKGKCNFHMMQEYFYPFALQMALRKTLPKSFLSQFNFGLTRLLGADLTGKWFKPIRQGYKLCVNYQEKALKPLSVKNILGVFILWGSGLGVAAITLVCEILLCRR